MILWKGEPYSRNIAKVNARPDKGIVKVIFKEHYYSFQIDAETGKVVSY